MDFSKELDPEQYAAVTQTEGAVLIIAGAGSGKTRVITYRIAKLLLDGVPEKSILALTFTNKAAKEMSDRARELVKKPLKDLMVSTFHAFGAWILRHEIHRLGWKENFTIYDEQDRLQSVKECARELGLAMDSIDIQDIVRFISQCKTALLPAAAAGEDWYEGLDVFRQAGDIYQRLFREYRKALYIYNAVDFDDLIAMPIELFARFPEIANNLRGRFSHIMIDEFQDTSLQQYEFIMAFAGAHICAVGDDDQSIYSWRGANFGNIEKFERDHPGYHEIKLERNYRSTSIILEAANSVIAHNVKRKKKNLWSPSDLKGVPIVYSEEKDEAEEAEQIVEKIRVLRISENLSWQDFGILVRTNAQARIIEETLMEAGVPYRTAGGPSFYQRKEVKDLIAYLRVAANPDDDVSVMRIINVPRRGIGKVGLEKMVSYARSHNQSLHDALISLERSNNPLVQQHATRDALEFFEFCANARNAMLSRKIPVSAQLREMVKEIGYWRYLLEEHKSDDKIAGWKYRNIELLIASIERWERDPDNFDTSLFAYLARIALITRDDPEDTEGKVSLLTIHSAKGLEYEIVFLPGCEEGIMPHARSVEEGDGDIEEERRLFYVALTRARKRLYLSRCLERKHYSQILAPAPSPFLDELPKELVKGEDEAKKDERSEEEIQRELFARFKARFTSRAG